MSVFMKLSEYLNEGQTRIKWLRGLIGGCLAVEVLSYLGSLEYSIGKHALYPSSGQELFLLVAGWFGIDTILFHRVALVVALLVLLNYVLRNNTWWSLGVWAGVVIFNYAGFLSYGFHYYVLMILAILGLAQLLEANGAAWSYIKVILALSYVNNAVAKLSDVNWTQGHFLQMHLNHHPLLEFLPTIGNAALVLSWCTIGLQLCYPLLLTSLRARYALCTMTIVMHLSICILLKLYIFSALMIGLNILLFCDPEVLKLKPHHSSV